MKHTLLLLKLFCAVLSVSLLGSCTQLNMDQASDNIELETSLGLPIGKISLNILDVANAIGEDGLVVDTSNQTMLIIMEDEPRYISFSFKDFVSGQSLSDEFRLASCDGIKEAFEGIPSGVTQIPLLAGTYAFETRNQYKFGFNEDKPHRRIDVDSLTARSANFDIHIEVDGLTIDEDNYLDIEVTFPNINNSDKNHIHTRMTTNTFDFSKKVNHFTVAFHDEDNTTDIVISYKYHCASTQMADIDSKIRYSCEYNIIDAEAAYGLFWQDDPVSTDNIEAEIDNSFFNNSNITNNKLLFHNPQLSLKFSTNLGMSVRAQIDSVYSTGVSGTEYFADFDGSTKLTVDFPRSYSEGDIVEKQVSFDREFGKTNLLFQEIPKKLNYQWRIYIPRPTTEEDARQFISNPIGLWAEMVAKIPIAVDPGSSFSYSDTIDMDLSAGSNLDLNSLDIDKLNIYLKVANSIPVTLNADISLIDEHNNTLLREDGITIKSPKVDEEGKSQETSRQEIILELGKDATKVLDTKKMVFNISLATYENISRSTIRTTDKTEIAISIFGKLKTGELIKIYNNKNIDL